MLDFENNANKQLLYGRLGRIVVSWSNLENLSKTLLTLFVAGQSSEESRYRMDIMLANQPNPAVLAVLKILANEYEETVYTEHVLHFIACADRLREYRNYYVHGITETREMADGSTFTINLLATSKGRLVARSETIEGSTLAEVLSHQAKLTSYLIEIILGLYGLNGDDKSVKESLAESKPLLPPPLIRSGTFRSKTPVKRST